MYITGVHLYVLVIVNKMQQTNSVMKPMEPAKCPFVAHITVSLLDSSQDIPGVRPFLAAASTLTVGLRTLQLLSVPLASQQCSIILQPCDVEEPRPDLR